MVKPRVLALGVTLLLAPLSARAQDATEATAAALFDEGMKLMDQGRYAEACPKLARSHQIAPTGGTVLNLGDCYERAGQYASAWSAYKQAAARAAEAGKKEFETMALDRAKRIEPKLSRLTLKLARPLEGMEIKRDGDPVSRAEWGVSALLDPGAHRFEVTAPGAKKWSTMISLSPGENKTLAIPELEMQDKAPAPAPETPRAQSREPRSDGSSQRTIGFVVGGAGLVGVAVGAIFGVEATSKDSDAKSHCRTTTLCDAEGVKLGKDAHDAATVSTIAFSVGGAALVLGAVLVFSAGKSEPAAAGGTLRVGVGPTGATIGGAW
jgi:hypothetical protein